MEVRLDKRIWKRTIDYRVGGKHPCDVYGDNLRFLGSNHMDDGILYFDALFIHATMWYNGQIQVQGSIAKELLIGEEWTNSLVPTSPVRWEF